MRNLTMLVLAIAMIAGITAVRPAQAAETYTIDPGHSSIVWTVGHMNGIGKVYGRFNTFSGTIVADADNPAASSVEVTVEAASVDTAIARRDDHLRNTDFFNAAEHPALTFKSTSVTAGASEGSYMVVGDLTMLGVTRPITIEIMMTGTTTGRDGEAVAGFQSEFSINRSEWGMGYGIPGLSDEIEIMLAFEAKGAAPAAQG